MPEITLDQKFIDVVVENLNVDRNSITPEASAMGTLGADSLDLVELVMDLEEAYDIEVDDEETKKLKNLGELQQLIWNKVAGKQDA